MGKFSGLDFFKKHQNISAFCIGCIGVALNIFLSNIVNALGLPLYLDTIGTIIIATIGGYLPGLLVGFFTNIIKSVHNPVSFYYGVLNVMIACTATFIANRSFKKYWHKILISILSFTFIGGGIGALIPWFMKDLTFDSESLSCILYKTGFFNQFFAHFFSSYIMDLPDTTVTVLLAELLLHFIPERFYPYSSFCMWLQKPFINEEYKTKDKTKVRVISVRMKTLLTLLFAFSIVALAETNISLYVYHKSIINEHKTLAMGTASLAAQIINGDRINDYLISKGNTEDYKETEKLLSNILKSSPT